MHAPKLLLLLLAALALAPAAQSQIRFLPYVGYNLNAGYDFESFFEDEDAEKFDTRGGFIVGVGAEFALTPGILPFAVKLRPSVETVIVPGYDETIRESGVEVTAEVSQSLFQLSGDVIAELSPPLSPVIPFAGVGLTYVTYSEDESFRADVLGEVDEESNSTDGSAFGVNLLGGIRFGGGFVAPFVQARYSLADPTPDEAEEADNNIGNALSILAGVSIGL